MIDAVLTFHFGNDGCGTIAQKVTHRLAAIVRQFQIAPPLHEELDERRVVAGRRIVQRRLTLTILTHNFSEHSHAIETRATGMNATNR